MGAAGLGAEDCAQSGFEMNRSIESVSFGTELIGTVVS